MVERHYHEVGKDVKIYRAMLDGFIGKIEKVSIEIL